MQLALIINEPSSPIEYGFDLGLPNGASARVNTDGSVTVASGSEVIGAFAVPWAVDAVGTKVPTRFEIRGNQLIQVIEHGQQFQYPIVADPWWNPFSWDWGKVWSKMKDCGVGAALGAVGLGAAEVSKNVALDLARRNLVKVTGGGYAYLGAAVAGCVVKVLS